MTDPRRTHRDAPPLRALLPRPLRRQPGRRRLHPRPVRRRRHRGVHPHRRRRGPVRLLLRRAVPRARCAPATSSRSPPRWCGSGRALAASPSRDVVAGRGRPRAARAPPRCSTSRCGAPRPPASSWFPPRGNNRRVGLRHADRLENTRRNRGPAPGPDLGSRKRPAQRAVDIAASATRSARSTKQAADAGRPPGGRIGRMRPAVFDRTLRRAGAARGRTRKGPGAQ